MNFLIGFFGGMGGMGVILTINAARRGHDIDTPLMFAVVGLSSLAVLLVTR